MDDLVSVTSESSTDTNRSNATTNDVVSIFSKLSIVILFKNILLRPGEVSIYCMSQTCLEISKEANYSRSFEVHFFKFFTWVPTYYCFKELLIKFCFLAYGTIAEPPGVFLDKTTCKATIPYEQKKCIDKLMAFSNGMLPIRRHSHFVNIVVRVSLEFWTKLKLYRVGLNFLVHASK